MIRPSIILAAASVVLAATAGAQSPPAAEPLPTIAPAGSLYARLGGSPVVSALVSESIDVVATNAVTPHSFDPVKLQRVKDSLAEQICWLSGGDCGHGNDALRDAPGGQLIEPGELVELVEALRVVMRKREVPLAARNELLEVLAPFMQEVVSP